ncbi:MAG: hypothetical protein WBA61_17090 [Aequorivita sp.]
MLQSAYSLRNEDFIDTIDVVCPKCHSKAIVRGGKPYQPIRDYELDVQFSCANCGFSLKFEKTQTISQLKNSKGQPIKSNVIFLNSSIDPFFGFDVWYQSDTRFGILWAYNLDHLKVIESYIAEKLRSRNGIPIRNNSMGSRFPQWVKEAKNRDYLLKNITKLKLK